MVNCSSAPLTGGEIHSFMRYSILFALLLPALTSNAQKIRFHEGFIVTKQGDTLRGLVHWKKNSMVGDSLLYKKNISDQPQRFSWYELTDAYDKNSRQSLKICTVKRNLEYIDGNDYTIRLKDSTSVELIPLTQVYRGSKLSLYSYYDKSPFYFLYDGINMFQLVQKYRYLNQVERMFDFEKGRRFEITDEYRGLLASYYNFYEDQKMRYILDNTLYEEGSLKHIISKMDSKLR